MYMELILTEGCWIKFCRSFVHCRTVALIQSHAVLITILFSTAGDGELIWKRDSERWPSYEICFP